MAKKRNSASQMAVWVILGLLIVGLMGFGATSFVSNNTAVATVGDREIGLNRYANEVQQEIGQFSRQFGTPLTFAQAQMFGIPNSVLGRMIATAAMENEATNAGISAGDEWVRNELLTLQAFQGVDGTFDREGYAFALRQANLTEGEFEEQLRDDMGRRLLVGAVTGATEAPEAYVNALLAYQQEARNVTWAVLAEGDLDAPIPDPTDEDLRAYWEENEDSFMLPETRAITYAWLTPEMLAETIEGDDEALQALYEDRAALYNQPERRLVEQLNYLSLADAQAAFDAVEAGEKTFDDLVADRGLDLADIDLGDVTPEALGAAGDVIFAMEGPGLAGPVETDLGAAIYRMNGILAPQTIGFDEARPELLAAYRAEEAARLIGDYIDEADDLLAGGATLEELAEETELELGTIDWAEGATDGPAALPEFRQAAISAEVGDFPEVLTSADGSIFAIRLNEVTEPRVEPFEDARSKVEQDWRRQTTVEALAEQARVLAEELRNAPAVVEEEAPAPDAPLLETDGDADSLLPDLAGEVAAEAEADDETSGPVYQTETGLIRTGTIPDTPTGFTDTIFAMEAGEVRVIEGATAAYLVRLDAINAPDLESDAMAELAEGLREQLSGGVRQDILAAFAEAVQAEAGISINQSTINAVHLQLGGTGGN